MPPMSEVLDLSGKLLGPAVAASLLVALLLGRLGRAKSLPLTAALAITAGVLAGNHFRELLSWRIDADQPLTWSGWRASLEASLEPMPPQDEASPAPIPRAFYWLPWLGLLAMLVELLVVRWADSGVAWSLRAMVALLAGRLLTPQALRWEHPWTPWALGLAILVQWGLSSTLCRRWRDGLVGVVQLGALLAAAAVILHAHSALLTDLTLLVAMALVGPLLAAWLFSGDASSASAAAALALPGLVLIAQQETFSEVPLRAFLLAGLAPVVLGLAVLPGLSQLGGCKRAVFVVLAWIPSAVAVYLAAQVEELPF